MSVHEEDWKYDGDDDSDFSPKSKKTNNKNKKKIVKKRKQSNNNISSKKEKKQKKIQEKGKAKSKTKQPKKSIEDQESLILEYMLAQNRPHNSTNVFSNLKVVRKAHVPRILDKLCDEKKLCLKQFKKSKIYFYNQDILPSKSTEELTVMDEKISQLDEKLKGTLQEISQQKNEIQHLSSQLSDDELSQKIQEFSTILEEKSKKIENLENKNQQILTKEQVDGLQKKFDTLYKAWKKRKRAAKDMMDTVLENAPRYLTRKKFMEKLCIETDEDSNHDIKQFEKLYQPNKKKTPMNRFMIRY